MENNLPAEFQEGVFDRESLKKDMASDLNIFAPFVAPNEVTLLFPLYYVLFFNIIKESLIQPRNFDKYALGLPRGFAKTFFMKIILCFAILFTKKQYIFIIAASRSKARAIVSDLMDLLEGPNVIEIFGDYRISIEKDTEDLKKFKINGRDIIIECAGYSAGIRGSSQKNMRPDIIVLDDAQTMDCAESIPEAEKFQKTFLGTIMKMRSPKGCTYLYLGNMYADKLIDPTSGKKVYTCMLRNLQFSPIWKTFIVGCILQDGKSLWEELYPTEQLLLEWQADRDMNREHIFLAELMNYADAQVNKHFDKTKTIAFEKEPGMLHNGSFIIIDPATSKLTPDKVVILYCELFDEVCVPTEIDCSDKTGPETVYFSLELAVRRQCSAIFVEDTAYQYELCNWFIDIINRTNLQGIGIHPFSNSGKNKNMRIVEMLKSYQVQEIQPTEAVKLVLDDQAKNFNALKPDNVDDVLDAVDMARRVNLTQRHLLTIEHFNNNERNNNYLPSTMGNSQPF